MKTSEALRPQYYGGESDPMECRKVIRAWGLNFNLGNVLKYTRRNGKKPDQEYLLDLLKARQYLTFEIEALSTEIKESEQ